MNLEEMKQHAADATRKRSEQIELPLFGELVHIVFIRDIGTSWAETRMKHRPRDGVAADKSFGYNVEAVCREVAARTGRQVVDGVEVEETSEWWDLLYATLDGFWTNVIQSTVWGLNEWEPQMEVGELKKASQASSGETSD